MNNYLTVFNITPQKNNRANWKDYWEIDWITDDKIIFKSKELYKYDFEEDSMKFDYHLILKLEIIEVENQNEKIYSNLYLVPTIDYLDTKKVLQVAEDYNVKTYMIDFDMISNEFIFPILAKEAIDIENIQEFSEKDEYIEKYLLSASIVSEVIQRILGFYMDQRMNKIGTTNWDLLHSCLEDIDPFKLALDRYSKNTNKEEE